jgi:hypothetical protein
MHAREDQGMHLALDYVHIKSYISRLQDLCLMHTAKRTRIQHLPCRAPRLLVSWQHRLRLLFGCTTPTSTTSCAATTRLSAASALHQLRRALRLLIPRSHGLCLDYVSRLGYSPLRCTGSIVLMSFIRTHRLRRSTSRRSVALALTMRSVTPSCGSTVPMLCI